MRDAYLSGIILRHLMRQLPTCENFKNVAKHSFVGESPKCAFMCRGECFSVTEQIADDVGRSEF